VHQAEKSTATPAVATTFESVFSKSTDRLPLPMPLDLADVRRIAHLSRLDLQAHEEAAMLQQLNGFFAIVAQMGAVDTSGVEPLYTPLAAVQTAALRLREDVVSETDERAANQASAPAVEDGLYLVPKVIE
jgi:aspartyl-tRNA(Asn)/glutamyl-tRNA(Gln) amidotransferase subunit C